MERPQKYGGLNFVDEYQRKELVGYNQCWDEYEKFLPDEKELRGLVARGYCTDRNSEKIIDPNLLEDIVEIISKRLKGK
jgi:hypothetical protein